MSWKYSVPYATRDLSSSRESSTQGKFAANPSKFASDRPSRWSTGAGPEPARTFRINPSQSESNPIIAKAAVSDNPSSVVQRLKEKYTSGGGDEKLSSTGHRPYGRSLTALNVGGASLKPKQTSYEAETRRDYGLGRSLQTDAYRLRNKSPEKDRSYRRSDSNQGYSAYSPKSPITYTSRLVPPKLVQNGPDATIEAGNQKENDTEEVTVVARGTSPSQTTTSIYLRTRRADFGIEKKIHRPKIKPPFSHKETQTDKLEETHISRYTCGDLNSRAKPWGSYGSSPYGSRYSTRSSFKLEKESPSYGVRSLSRESSSIEPKSPESPHSPKSLTDTPSPVTAKPPASFRSTETIKLNIQKPIKDGCEKVTQLRKAPSSTIKPLKIEPTSTADDRAKSPTPKKPAEPDRKPIQVNGNPADSSSMSESSSEDETSSSDEEVERIRSSETSFVKRSITNFLQNKPNAPIRKQPSSAELVNRSRSGLFHRLNGQLGPPKITFTRVESGERAWWLENPDQVPEGVVRIVSNCCIPKPDDAAGNGSNPNNSRCNAYLINRQFTTDFDWLRDPEEELPESRKWDVDGNNNLSRTIRLDEPIQENCDSSLAIRGNDFINNDNTCDTWSRDNCSNAGDVLARNEVNLSQILSDFEESIDVTPGLRRRREQNRAKSPEVNHQDGNHPYNGDEMKERNQGRIQQNGVASPVEEKNGDIGDMTNLISKARAGLTKSKTKPDVRKSSSREMSPKQEIDLYWKELVDSINRPLKLCDLDFTDLNTDDETDLFGKGREEGEIPPPPPPMLILPPCNRPEVPAPPTANRMGKTPAPPPPMMQSVKNKKTVKLFWKEVKDESLPPARPPGVTIIWDELSKVEVDTQKLEQLFESRAKDLMTKKQHEQNKSKEIIVLDHKRSNAINIGMTKLPPPRAIKNAILKMDSTVVNKEGIEKLLTMLPTEEEKLRIQDAQLTNPDLPLGSAEQFLLILASISELEARLKLWAFKLDFENVEKEICEPLMDLKHGIEILKTNKTFRAILSTLLSIGNFLNGCDAKGFQIDYLSKVPEVKDTVQKHSLLHHLCAIVMEKFPESTDLYSEIGAVTRASKVDFDELTGSIKKIEEDCKLSWSYLKMIAKHEGHTAMKVKMSDFLADCAERIIVLGIVHKRIMSRFHKFAYWLGVPTNRISIARPNELFKVISEFALEYRTTRERILQQIKKMNHREKNRSRGCLTGDAIDGGGRTRAMNSKEAKDDARLRQLLSGDPENLQNGTVCWRRHRKDARILLEANGNDDEIIETLIKTANQIPSHRPSVKDRKRTTKVYDRKC